MHKKVQAEAPQASVRSWSHSSAGVFQQCRHRFFLKYVKRIKEPERELPAGKTEHANDRGSRIHDAAERFINGTGPMIQEMRKFEAEFLHMRNLFISDRVRLEGEWGMDENWVETDWRKAWLRGKLDALVYTDKQRAIVIDYKSGKAWGNEGKHGEQMQLYQLLTFLRHPELEEVTVELWYLDVDELTSKTFYRSNGLKFKRAWDARGKEITSNTDWRANPNKFSCQWCPYGPSGTGDCKVGLPGNFRMKGAVIPVIQAPSAQRARPATTKPAIKVISAKTQPTTPREGKLPWEIDPL